MTRRLLLLLIIPWLLAFGGNDRFLIELEGGVTVQGWYVRIDDESLILSGGNSFQAIPLSLVREVTLNDVPLSLAAFQARVEAARQDQRLASLKRRRAAPPGIAATLSLGLAGAGHLAVGEPREATGWMLLDGALLGAGAWALWGERSVGAALPILGLDILVKAAAASDAARQGRRARGRRSPGAQRETSINGGSSA